jgi:translocation and assembly module TamB
MAVESALCRESFFSQGSMRGPKSAKYTPPPSSRRESDYPKFKLDIDVTADKGVLIQNDLFDAEAKAHVTVVNTLDTPRVVGTAEVVQGKLIFKDRVFQLQSAQVNFDSPEVINPKFNLSASTEVNDMKIQLYVTGRMDAYKVEFTSNPPMSSQDILALLAIGLSPQDMQKLKSGDRSSIEQGEAASLLLHSLDFNRDVQKKTGIQIQVDESVNTLNTTSIFRPRSADNDVSGAPRIVIKKQIGTRLDVSVGNTVGGTANQREVNAELHVTPGLSVQGVWDTYDSSSSDLTDRQLNSSSYGVDLKLQKRFK